MCMCEDVIPGLDLQMKPSWVYHKPLISLSNRSSAPISIILSTPCFSIFHHSPFKHFPFIAFSCLFFSFHTFQPISESKLFLFPCNFYCYYFFISFFIFYSSIISFLLFFLFSFSICFYLLKTNDSVITSISNLIYVDKISARQL